ncbi:unnamed protein product [Gongylonema pulchrum]|uniref:Uncharacterized protein n=1 Tax=Gongylonema pulchrum TaxID=637853 RepID=A0A183EQV9_9BILA|nr:unnamed protein product [Gongylonema pulchrum]
MDAGNSHFSRSFAVHLSTFFFQPSHIFFQPSHILRVSEFIRQYRRFADDLSPLISYFEKYGQPHLAEILSKSYVHEERPLLTDRQINFRLSVEGNVPHRLYNYVERRELIRDLEEVLIRLASLGRRFVKYEK